MMRARAPLLRSGAGQRVPASLLIAALAAPALVLLPIVTTLTQAGGVGLGDAVAALYRPLIGALIVNTITLVLATVLATALIGTSAAWLVERTDLPGRRIWGALAAVPLAIPAFVTSYTWVSISPLLQDFGGALLVVVCAYYPLVYLPVAAALRGLDPALEETAQMLGFGPWRCFFRVVLPQLRPAILGGMLLVALNTLTEFGAFALLRYRTFTTEIYAVYRTSFNGAEASLLASVLLILCLACLVAESSIRGRRRYARIARGVRRVPSVHRLGAARGPVAVAFLGLTMVTTGLPLGMLAYWSLQHGADAISPVQASPARVIAATVSSVGLGLVGAFATTTLAFPISYLATRYEGSRLAALAERSTFLAQGVPGIVVALALVALVIHNLQPLYQSTALLVVAYAILFLPLAMVSIRATLGQVPRGLEEAGRVLGLGPIAATWRITLPQAASGIAAAAVLVFVSIATELTATLLLAPTGVRTLATQVWSNTSTLAFAAAAPFAATMTTISLLAALLLAGRYGRAGAPAAL